MELQTGKTLRSKNSNRVKMLDGYKHLSAHTLVTTATTAEVHNCTSDIFHNRLRVSHPSTFLQLTFSAVGHPPNVRWNLGRCGSWRGESRTNVPNSETSPVNYL